jgi:hypothetical protein
MAGVIRACLQCGSATFHALTDYSSPPGQIVECGACGFITTPLGAMAGDCGLKLKLLNPIRLPLDDNINAVLLSEAGRG